LAGDAHARRPAGAVCDNYPVPLRSTCLCLLIRTSGDGMREVLLGHKKTGLGTGKIVGLGGHVEPGESAVEAAAREVKEESGIRVSPAALTEAARVTFLFPSHSSWDMDVVIFTAADWSGDPAESEEIRPQWFPVAALPFDRMWDDAPHWLPRVLAGDRLRATFSYAPDNETVAESAITPLP
jgi:8-oxo-dGTP diphosphatase